MAAVTRAGGSGDAAALTRVVERMTRAGHRSTPVRAAAGGGAACREIVLGRYRLPSPLLGAGRTKKYFLLHLNDIKSIYT